MYARAVVQDYLRENIGKCAKVLTNRKDELNSKYRYLPYGTSLPLPV